MFDVNQSVQVGRDSFSELLKGQEAFGKAFVSNQSTYSQMGQGEMMAAMNASQDIARLVLMAAYAQGHLTPEQIADYGQVGDNGYVLSPDVMNTASYEVMSQFYSDLKEQRDDDIDDNPIAIDGVIPHAGEESGDLSAEGSGFSSARKRFNDTPNLNEKQLAQEAINNQFLQDIAQGKIQSDDPNAVINERIDIDRRIFKYVNDVTLAATGNYEMDYFKSVLESLDRPIRRDLIGHNIASVQPYEKWVPDPATNSEKMVQQQVSDSKGRRGRSVLHKGQAEKLKTDLERVLRATLKENYQKVGIVTTTGVLEKSIEQGTVKDTGDFDFTYTIADLPGERRDWETANSQHPRRTTHYYGPIVFGGRPGIISEEPKKSMVFLGDGETLTRRRVVGPADPKNIFELDDTQIARIDAVMRNSITASIEDYLKEWGA